MTDIFGQAGSATWKKRQLVCRKIVHVITDGVEHLFFLHQKQHGKTGDIVMSRF